MKSIIRQLPLKLVASIVVPALFGSLVSATTQATDPIQSIRQQYANINRSAAKYRKVRKELSGFSTEGGELIAWFKGPSIVKMAATYFGERGRTTEEYYYLKDKLIFVFRKDSRYNRPLSGKVVSTSESRFYFKDYKLIRWIDKKGFQVSPTEPDYATHEAYYLTISKQFTEGARSKSRIIESP